MYYVFYGKALLMKSNNSDHIMQTIFPFILNEKVKCNIYLLCFDYDDYYDLDKYIDFYDPNRNYICFHNSGEFELNDISLFKKYQYKIQKKIKTPKKILSLLENNKLLLYITDNFEILYLPKKLVELNYKRSVENDEIKLNFNDYCDNNSIYTWGYFKNTYCLNYKEININNEHYAEFDFINSMNSDEKIIKLLYDIEKY